MPETSWSGHRHLHSHSSSTAIAVVVVFVIIVELLGQTNLKKLLYYLTSIKREITEEIFFSFFFFRTHRLSLIPTAYMWFSYGEHERIIRRAAGDTDTRFDRHTLLRRTRRRPISHYRGYRFDRRVTIEPIKTRGGHYSSL